MWYNVAPSTTLYYTLLLYSTNPDIHFFLTQYFFVHLCFMSTTFVEFLVCVKDVADRIKRLTADVETAKQMYSHSQYIDKTNTHMDKLASNFHTKAQDIQARIQKLKSKTNRDNKQQIHVTSLTQRLYKQVNTFVDIRNKIEKKTKERAETLKQAGIDVYDPTQTTNTKIESAIKKRKKAKKRAYIFALLLFILICVVLAYFSDKILT